MTSRLGSKDFIPKFFFSFVIFVILASLPFGASAKTLDKVVAVVQGKAILLSDVQSLTSQVKNSDLLRSFYKIDGGINEQSILNRLVEDQIIRARLKELGAEVSGDAVNREISEIARKNQLTTAQLKSVLTKQKVDFQNYFDALKSQLERRSIFAREISTSGSTLTDEELKTLYRNKAPPEYKLSIIVDSVSKKNRGLLDQIASEYKSGKLSLEKIKEHPNYVDLGWLAVGDVAEAFKKGLAKAQVGEAVGPIKQDGKLQLLIVESSRKGSDDQFEKVKETFRGSLEELETEKKFRIWFEKQKNLLEVSINAV